LLFEQQVAKQFFPKLTEELERFGVKDKIVSFMLP
jgi:hypothetical protein